MNSVSVLNDDGTNAAIKGGAKAGDRVITEGLQFIKPGIEVKVTDAKNATAAGTAPAAPAAAGKGE